MKKFALLAVLAGTSLFASGCATPAYSGQERTQLIGRNVYFEFQQISDDVDHLFLLRPATHLTEWNIQ